MYYADGLLVHNCDSASQALSHLIYSAGDTAPSEMSKAEKREQREVAEFLDSDAMYDVYGDSSIW